MLFFIKILDLFFCGVKMDQSKKRERATNFDISEVRLLTELVTKYRSVLENKKTDTVSNKEKEGAWNKIATAFNATSSEAVVRTAKTLKIKYESLKKSTRKKMTLHRQLYKTGDRPTAPDINSVDETVLETCSNISGLDANNDSDNIAGCECNTTFFLNALSFYNFTIIQSIIVSRCSTRRVPRCIASTVSQYNTF